MDSTTALPPEARTLRRLAPPASPWPGALATGDDGMPLLVVDVEVVGHWPGWGITGAEHLLTVTDVARRPDGHEVLMPACTETLLGFLARRRGSGTPLTDGEVVTVTASVVRGVGEAVERGLGRETGTWWLTPDGRPLFVLGEGPEVGAASAEALEHVAGGSDATGDDVAGLVRRAADAVRDPRRLRSETGLDAALLAAAAPRALDLSRASHARDDLRRPSWPAPRARTRTDADSWTRVCRDRVASAIDDIRVRLRRPGAERDGRRRRRGPLLVMLVVAAATVGGMLLLWPSETSSPVHATSPAASSASDAVSTPPAPRESPAPSTPSPTSEAGGRDPVQATAALLTARSACGDAAGCLRDVVEDPSRRYPAGAVDLPEQDRTVALLDSFGGVAVVRVEPRSGVGPAGMSAQIVVIVARDDEWLLRDVHDAAEQPS